jgi:hypothetical protein
MLTIMKSPWSKACKGSSDGQKQDSLVAVPLLVVFVRWRGIVCRVLCHPVILALMGSLMQSENVGMILCATVSVVPKSEAGEKASIRYLMCKLLLT